MMKLTLEEIAEMLKKNNGDVEAVKQYLTDVQEGVSAQNEIVNATHLIILKRKLDPISSACSIALAAVKGLDIVGQFFKKSRKEREEFVRATLTKTIEVFYETTEEED